MVQELDDSFAAVVLLGYHSKAGSEGNPLAHTLTGKIAQLRLNGEVASEFLLHARAAALFDVPVVFVSSDRELCRDIATFNRRITTVAVSEGIGPSTVSIAPTLAQRRIREGVAAALGGDLASCRVALPDRFTLEIVYNNPVDAYRASWYPGMQHPAPQTVRLDTADYFEVLRAIRFVVL
jgi:D-amino peptidase